MNAILPVAFLLALSYTGAGAVTVTELPSPEAVTGSDQARDKAVDDESRTFEGEVIGRNPQERNIVIGDSVFSLDGAEILGDETVVFSVGNWVKFTVARPYGRNIVSIKSAPRPVDADEE